MTQYRFTDREFVQVKEMRDQIQRLIDGLNLYILGVLAAREIEGDFDLSQDGRSLIAKLRETADAPPQPTQGR